MNTTCAKRRKGAHTDEALTNCAKFVALMNDWCLGA